MRLMYYCLFILCFMPFTAMASDPPKPELFRWANYGVSSSCYLQGTAVAEGILKTFNIKVRTVPLDSGMARMKAVHSKQVDFFYTGCDSAYAWKGVEDWASKVWGPQKIRIVWLVNLKSTYAVATRGNTGIKTLNDLKGRKVAYIVGSPSLNAAVTGALNLVGLTWNDVEKVNYPGLGAGYTALKTGAVDAVGVNAASPVAYEMASMPSGIYWIPYPTEKENPKGWKEFARIYPGTFPIVATVGGGISEKKPVYTAHFAFPAMFTFDSASEDLVYWQVKAIAESYETYKNSTPDLPQWNIKEFVNIPLNGWYTPIHAGAVKYLKEKGLWTSKMEIHQNTLLAEEKQRLKLWEQASDKRKMDDNQFKAFWLGELRKADLD